MTILIPTDFSPCAQNAADFALSIFNKAEQVRFVLLNAFKLDILGNTGKSYAELKSESEMHLETERFRMLSHSQNKAIDIEALSVEGRINYLNGKLLDEIGVDFVVMGTEGLSEEDRYLGTTHAGELVVRLQRSLLVVPSVARYKNGFNKVLFATDYPDSFPPESMTKIKYILNGAETLFLTVHHADEPVKEPNENQRLKIISFLGERNIKFEQIEGENTEVELLRYIRKNDMDAIVVFPRKVSLFEQVFQKSTSRKITHTSPVPILALY